MVTQVATEEPEKVIEDIKPQSAPMFYADDVVSPEEKRAMLPKYRFHPATVQHQLDELDKEITESLKLLNDP
jgi:hypothetical protein